MEIPTTYNYTKDDFLNYKQLATKLGRDPQEIYKAMLHHFRNQTPIKYKSPYHIGTTAMIINMKRTSTKNKHALLLHPLGLEKFIQYLNTRTK